MIISWDLNPYIQYNRTVYKFQKFRLTMGYKKFSLVLISVILVTLFFSQNSFAITTPNTGIVNYTQISNYTQSFNNTSYVPINTIERIGIEESQTCLTLLQHSMANNCIPYEKVKKFDMGNPLVFGQWTDTPFTHRLSTRIHNTFQFVLPNTVIVDPDADYIARSKNIVLQDGPFTWINPNDVITNHTRTEYHDVFVAGCSQATVYDASYNLQLINDTIQYMLHDCQDVNFYKNHMMNFSLQVTAWDYNNPYSTLHHIQFLNTILHGHSLSSGNHTSGGNGPPDCIRHKCDYTDPYHKAEW